MAKSKTPKATKAPAAPKAESKEWAKAAEKLNEKKASFEKGEMPGYDYNTYVLPLIHLYESSNRSVNLLAQINQL